MTEPEQPEPLNAPSPDGTFVPMIHYDTDGQCIEIHLTDESYVGHHLGPHLTVYRSPESGQVVGLIITNIDHLIATAKQERAERESGKVYQVQAIDPHAKPSSVSPYVPMTPDGKMVPQTEAEQRAHWARLSQALKAIDAADDDDDD